MDGKQFFLVAVHNESPYFRASFESLGEARRHFQPVAGKTFFEQACQSQNTLRLLERERQEEREQAENLHTLLDSALNRAQTLEEEIAVLKQGLYQANRRAQESEISCRCSICLSGKISVVCMPCQHACCCMPCWKRWSKAHGSFAPCPLCRKETVASMEMRL